MSGGVLHWMLINSMTSKNSRVNDETSLENFSFIFHSAIFNTYFIIVDEEELES